jgi:pyruvate formate lyase activating enzyme
MVIGGSQKFTLLDYPGHIAAIIFTAGCNFRCQFCYNPMLVVLPNEGKAIPKLPKGHPRISEEGLLEFLEKRAGKLDGVVITGGEPTMHKDLPEFCKKIKELGYSIKLDTNGTNPKMLKVLGDKKLIDYIAMDIKGPEKVYVKITNTKVNLKKIYESIAFIMQCGLQYEFRTTLVPDLVGIDDISKIGKMIKGAEVWYLQVFKSDIDLVNCGLKGKSAYPSSAMEKIKEIGSKYVKKCEIR